MSRGDVSQNNKIPFFSSQLLKDTNDFHLFLAGVRTSSESRGGETEDHLETMRTTTNTHGE